MNSHKFLESKKDFIKDLGRYSKCRVRRILRSSGIWSRILL